MNANTDEYYRLNALRYFEETVSADLSATCLRFLKHIKPGGHIIDIGCGSGRDLRFFIEHGYQAEGIDASEELCQLARQHSGAGIRCERIETWHPHRRFDGLWGCASLLHLRMEAIEVFFGRLSGILAEDGAAFFSFKTGIESGVDRHGRYFTAFSTHDLRRILDMHPELILLEQWENDDAMLRQDVVWLNFILGCSKRS
ncbi:MAG: class I SAM-dependent methyltransferase [Desulfovibrio sp.]|nr:class I SAM-dependent methyltransferase [Desulfovibrio sp.]